MCYTLEVKSHFFFFFFICTLTSLLTQPCFFIIQLHSFQKCKRYHSVGYAQSCATNFIRVMGIFTSYLKVLHVTWVNRFMARPVIVICEQQGRRTACASAHSDQCLCCCCLNRIYWTKIIIIIITKKKKKKRRKKHRFSFGSFLMKKRYQFTAFNYDMFACPCTSSTF